MTCCRSIDIWIAPSVFSNVFLSRSIARIDDAAYVELVSDDTLYIGFGILIVIMGV
jgi:hypothetical protein